MLAGPLDPTVLYTLGLTEKDCPARFKWDHKIVSIDRCLHKDELLRFFFFKICQTPKKVFLKKCFSSVEMEKKFLHVLVNWHQVRKKLGAG
jgi:hypothetical protein